MTSSRFIDTRIIHVEGNAYASLDHLVRVTGYTRRAAIRRLRSKLYRDRDWTFLDEHGKPIVKELDPPKPSDIPKETIRAAHEVVVFERPKIMTDYPVTLYGFTFNFFHQKHQVVMD